MFNTLADYRNKKTHFKNVPPHSFNAIRVFVFSHYGSWFVVIERMGTDLLALLLGRMKILQIPLFVLGTPVHRMEILEDPIRK